MRNYDVIIAGGAIIGSSSAWFLSRQAEFNGRVLVIEKDPSYRTCSTTLSISSIRQQFSSVVNIRISRFGFKFLQSIDKQGGRDGCIGLVEQGYLLLAGDGGAELLRRNVQLQRSEGADIGLFDLSELAKRYPWLSVEGVTMASFGLSGEGWFDAYSLMQYFRCGAREHGVTFIQGEVAGLDVKAGRVASVLLADGSRYGCGHFVNASGTGAANIAKMARINVRIEPRKRCVFVIDCRDSARVSDCPHLIDYTGVWVKPKGQYFITGTTPPEDRDPPCSDFDVDHYLFDEYVWPVLARRIPVFEAVKVVSAWAGHYAYNILDQNAIIGPHPLVRNFLFANGFSGHGVQQAPAVGRGISEYIVHGKYVTLDLSELGFDRILEGRAVLEKNVF
jgi:FAD-dependent oxidoreductase domain-containing protein 1